MVSFGSARDWWTETRDWLDNLIQHGFLLEPELEPSNVRHLLLRRMYINVKVNVKKKYKLILIRALTFVMYVS